MKNEGKTKAVFFDRDGVFNKLSSNDYILHKKDFFLMEGIDKVVKGVKDMGFLTFLVTNQSCVEQGLISEAGLNDLHQEIHTYLAKADTSLDAVHFCPHLSEKQCHCKKPKPGMILAAAKKFNVDLKNSFMVGDRWFDIAAGHAAGCRTIFARDGERNKIDLEICRPDFIVKSVKEVLNIVKNNSRKPIVGFTAGTMDLCHAGHILMLKEAKKVCDYLVVGLQSDPSIDRPEKQKPIMSVKERKIILEGIKYVDKVVVYNTEADLIKLIKKIKPNIRIIGADWKGKNITGAELAKELGYKIHFNKRNHNYSSSELRKRIYLSEKEKNKV